jgi:general secretion pathway protein G
MEVAAAERAKKSTGTRIALTTRMIPVWHGRTRFRRARGATLVEILVVVALIALITGAVAVAVLPGWVTGRAQMAETNARGVRNAVKTWWVHNDSSVCPTVDRLVADGILDRGSPRQDPWGNPWKIVCENQDVTIVTPGADKQFGTSDDIRVPPA